MNHLEMVALTVFMGISMSACTSPSEDQTDPGPPSDGQVSSAPATGGNDAQSQGAQPSQAVGGREATATSEESASLSPLPPGCVLASEGGCDPNPPHNDSPGMVCTSDGRVDEGYCTYDNNGALVCAYMTSGGPCESGTPGPSEDSDSNTMTTDPVAVPTEAGEFSPEPVPDQDPLNRFFAQQIVVFGVRIVASAGVSDPKLVHAANVMAEYLDNDEDGEADDPPVVEAMIRRNALLVMFGSGDELESSGLFESDLIDQYHGQDLQGDETAQAGRFDAALEEVLHLITTAGYEQVYPQAFGSSTGSLLANAMDAARGGRFESIPTPYPEEAWYHYDDQTCDYRCMAVEYFYWALTTLLGAQSDPDRCQEISVEWTLCTAEALASADVLVHALLTDPQYRLPTSIPDGQYAPSRR